MVLIAAEVLVYGVEMHGTVSPLILIVIIKSMTLKPL